LAALGRALPGISRAAVLDGREVLASVGRASPTLERTSLADKALYDRAVRTRALLAEGRDAVLRAPAFDSALTLISAPVDPDGERVFLAVLDPRQAPGAGLGGAV